MKRILSMSVVLLLLLVYFTSVTSAFKIDTYISNGFSKNTNNLLNSNGVFDGYILFAPWLGKVTYLIDNYGKIVNKWRSNYIRAGAVHLLENGNLLRSSTAGFVPPRFFFTGGCSGRIEMFNWDGKLIWTYKYITLKYCLHNDIVPLPNGNILMLVWDYKTHEEVIGAGMNTASLTSFGPVMIDRVIEVEPIFPKGGTIVWEWHTWDHLIQDFDPAKNNYGVVADHPELIDLNSKGRRLVYSRTKSDFTHFNSIDYNEKLDQILLSSRYLNEIFIIDHSTTTEEASGYTGGNSGRGGDILYRWGNPQNYGAGDKSDQKLFAQHDARWVREDLPGEGHITIFNNGCFRPGEEYSSVVEINPPLNENGTYDLIDGSAYCPEKESWIYTAENPTDFYSYEMSGAQRLPDGNTLICSGAEAKFFVVNPDKEILWEYFNKFPIPILGINYVFKTQYYAKDHINLDDIR